MVGAPPKIAVYYKASLSLDTESVQAISQEVKEVLDRLYSSERFAKNLRYLKRQGITQRMLCGILNITGRSIQYWRRGEVTPRNLYCFLMVGEITKRLREKAQAQKAAGVTPRVV
ncbi:unnamed protein product, partial [marine sediment metagenome]